MGIRKFFYETVILLTTITLFVVIFNSIQVQRSSFLRLKAIGEQYLNATYEIYQAQLIGGILIGDDNIISSLIQEISETRKVGIILTNGKVTLSAGLINQSAPTSSYTLNTNNDKKTTLKLFLPHNKSNLEIFYESVFPILLELIVLCIGICYLLKGIKQKFISPLNDLVLHLDPEKIEQFEPADKSVDEIKQLCTTLKKMNVEVKKNASYEAEVRSAKQVAHDIRSPLAALNTVLLDIPSMKENKRILIKNALNRINDIANNLLFHAKSNIHSIENTDSYPELLFVILDNLISEKRYEHCDTNVNIQLNISSCSYDSFAEINIGSFKRVLSNLINNSIESISSNGLVTINLESNEKNTIININDNGCGIPDEILPKITNQGFSFNKKNGAGFGLSYAKKYIEQLGGELTIQSELNIGTNITIKLVKAQYPNWFCNRINIQENTTIVVLDDDPSIHNTWKEKLSHIDVKIINLSTVAILTQEKIKELNPSAYLIDYELLHDDQNGLDVIKSMKLNERAVLVTSCFEDLNVRKRCEELGVRIIPKSYVPFIPIVKIQSNKIIVLIDNDKMIRMIWELVAEEAGINITTYSSPTEFSNQIKKHNKNTAIYIDSDLGNHINGEIYAKDLHAQGFTEIHLTTGYPTNQFGDMPWIKSVIGKVPPF